MCDFFVELIVHMFFLLYGITKHVEVFFGFMILLRRLGNFGWCI